MPPDQAKYPLDRLTLRIVRHGPSTLCICLDRLPCSAVQCVCHAERLGNAARQKPCRAIAVGQFLLVHRQQAGGDVPGYAGDTGAATGRALQHAALLVLFGLGAVGGAAGTCTAVVSDPDRPGAWPAIASPASPDPAPAMAEPQPPRLSYRLITSQSNCV